MASQLDKKLLEAYYLNRVRQKISDFPPGEPIESERPDFLFLDASLGVELTRIFRAGNPKQPSLPQFEAEAECIVHQAQTLAIERGMPPTLIDIYFDDKASLRAKHRDATARAITSLIEDVDFGTDGWQRLERGLDSRLPPQVMAISARRYAWVRRHLWQVAGAGIVVEDFQTELQNEISAKNRQLPEYRKQCAMCWLIVLADWRGPSGFFEMSESTREAFYNFDFERVYFFEVFSGEVHELRKA